MDQKWKWQGELYTIAQLSRIEGCVRNAPALRGCLNSGNYDVEHCLFKQKPSKRGLYTKKADEEYYPVSLTEKEEAVWFNEMMKLITPTSVSHLSEY